MASGSAFAASGIPKSRKFFAKAAEHFNLNSADEVNQSMSRLIAPSGPGSHRKTLLWGAGVAHRFTSDTSLRSWTELLSGGATEA